jgi:hypothetical protein
VLLLLYDDDEGDVGFVSFILDKLSSFVGSQCILLSFHLF